MTVALKHPQHEKITEVLGIDPSRPEQGGGVFSDVLEKIAKERVEEAKGRVEKEIRELMTLVQSRDSIVKEFSKKLQEVDKKIDKAFNRVKGIKGGQQPQEEGETKEEGTTTEN